MTKKLAALLSVFLTVAPGLLVSSALATPQEVALPDVKATGESSNEVLLSKEDDVVLNTSFIASAILRGADKVPKGSSLFRVVSLASFLTVQEAWQPTMSHGCDTVDALSSQAVLILAGHAGKGYEITVTPLVGLNWMKVEDINDLQFIVRKTGK